MTKPERPRLGARIGNIDPNQLSRPGAAGDSQSPRTGVGLVMGAIAGSSDLEKRLAHAQGDLATAQAALSEREGDLPTRLLDTTSVRVSRWANRDEENFAGADWEEFKAELNSAGGNVQPIKVRRLPEPEPNGSLFEVVFGHRRLRGCHELGLKVLAMVADHMTDETLFAEMDRENRQRKNLSAYEQGRSYVRALAEGMYPSQRQMAERLGVNLANLSRACALAKLPDDVVKAFPSPLALQVRMAKPLGDKLQADPEGVLERARKLQQEKGKVSAADVLARLLGNHDRLTSDELVISTTGGGRAASFKTTPKGRAVVEFEAGILAPGRYQALMQMISEFLKS